MAHDGIVYSREFAERTLTFNVSGLLWETSMVLVDVETGSLWSQVTGKAMRGSLKGERLQTLPAVVTTWAEWKQLAPHTQVINLPRERTDFRRSFQLQRHLFSIGMAGPRDSLYVSFQTLARRRVINFEFEGQAHVATYDDHNTAARIYSRELAGQTLEFQPARFGRMADRATGSIWDIASGKAIAGPLAGQRLSLQPGIVAFQSAWRAFHPGTRDLSAELPPDKRSHDG